jgi:hypothetical protein
MLRPIRRHTKDCSRYGSKKLKCPLIIVRYEMGPSGWKIRKEQSLGTNDEKVAWDLIH